MNSWIEWHTSWRSAFDGLNRLIAPPTFTRLPVRAAVERETRQAEAAARGEVDLVCFAYARCGTWPPMSDTVRWFAMLRVVHALQLTAAIAPQHHGEQILVPAAGVTDRALCEWFLVYAWVAGREEWLPKLVDYSLAAQVPSTSGMN
jgi:hypothetical protein